MKKTLLSILTLSSLAFAGMNNDTIDYSELDKISSHELTRSVANEVAKNLPIQIDYLTKIVNVFGIANSVITKKEVDIKHQDINSLWTNDKNKLITAMYQLDSKNICYEPVWEYMIMKRGIVAEFNYVDTDSKPLFKYTVEKADCKKLLK